MCAMAGTEASSALCEHVQRQGLHGHLFSDITVSFHNKDYKLHRIILSQSSYFRSLLSGPWKESGKPRVELRIDDHNVTANGLETAISFMYGVTPTFTGDSVVGVLAAGCFLCMENLCEQCVQFMVKDIREETFVAYQQLSEHHCYGRFAEGVRDACWSFLCGHAARELRHALPKLSLQLLCRLLKSDELWVPSESERYKIAKESLTEWKLVRIRASTAAYDASSSKKLRIVKSYSRKSLRPTQAGKQKEPQQKNSKPSPKEKLKSKKETTDHKILTQQREDISETALRKLRRLWEEDGTDDSDILRDSFDSVIDLFAGGGIIFAYMDANEALQARKELEDANMPTDVVNDAIWQNVLLKARVLKETESSSSPKSSSDDEDEDELMPDDEDEEDDEEENDEEDDESDPDTSDSDEDGWSTDRSSQEEDNANERAVPEAGETTSAKRSNTALVGYSTYPEEDLFDGKRRKTTGGFTWAAKLDTCMQMGDFPPFRFGVEFLYVDRSWMQVSGADYVFYGGSMWKITVTHVNKEEWLVSVGCSPWQTSYEPHAYQDQRRKVVYTAKLYVQTCGGLQCVTGTGQRKSKFDWSPTKYDVGTALTGKDLNKDKSLRVAAVVQLVDD